MNTISQRYEYLQDNQALLCSFYGLRRVITIYSFLNCLFGVADVNAEVRVMSDVGVNAADGTAAWLMTARSRPRSVEGRSFSAPLPPTRLMLHFALLNGAGVNLHGQSLHGQGF